MIDVSVVSRGSLTATPIISRPTTNYKIEQDVIISCSIFVNSATKEYVKYVCAEFPSLITPNWNRDVGYFLILSSATLTNGPATIKYEIGVSEDDILQNYTITIDRSFFETLNVTKYEMTIRKLLKTITGV